jgi:hypothetical protein
MSDFTKLKDIFEMAEVLEHEGEGYLEISAPCELEQKVIIVKFLFNSSNELIEVSAE